MPAEVKKEIELEIAHVLFLDIVGYSKLSVNEQHARVDELNGIVRLSEQYQKAEAANRILKIPTGDGMALVFYKSPEEPAQCAFEIGRALKDNQRLQVRMGIHSGPVSGVVDVNERTNVAGGGINLAQRVMDCGDAGHILLSHHVAEDLEQFERWRPFLHDIGTFEVKHGVRVSVTNLYSDEVGNPNLPSKLEAINQALRKHRAHVRWAAVAVALLVLGAIVGGTFFFFHRPTTSALRVLDKSIAVLPFENLSEEKANAFFTEGVQDEILTDLARIADLKVISRTSVMEYRSGTERNMRQIGQQLGVAHVVEGSVQRSGNRVRVNAQLIDARTDTHLWGQSYDRDLTDIFAIQSEIARAIADQLQAALSPREKTEIERPPTHDIIAFDLYSRANDILSGKNNRVADVVPAVDMLNRAVARDPSFLEAYCKLAFAHDVLYSEVDRTPERLAMAKAAIDSAFRLKPDSGEAHLAQAVHLYRGYRDYDGALAELEVARQTLPNQARIFALMGDIQRRHGRLEEARRNLQRAAELDPRDADILMDLSDIYLQLGRFAEAKSWLTRALAVAEPDDVRTKLLPAEWEFYINADPRPMHQTIESIRAANPATVKSGVAGDWLDCALAERDPAAARKALSVLEDSEIGFGGRIVFNRAFVEGLIARMANDEDKAQLAFAAARAQQEKVVQAQPDSGPAWCVLGMIDAGLGRKEDALREGRRAIDLLPMEKDAFDGHFLVRYFAIIAAWVGEKDLACEQLAILLRPPRFTHYGGLKLLPLWDPLRGYPCFEKIVASLAPKQ